MFKRKMRGMWISNPHRNGDSITYPHKPPLDNTGCHKTRRGHKTERRTGVGGEQKYIMLYQRHSFQRVAVPERRVSPLSSTARRFALLSCTKAWCAANRAPSADPLTSTEDEHQQHVHKHQNRDHRKHRASLDIQGHGAALRADAGMRCVFMGRSQLHRLDASKRPINPPLPTAMKKKM